MKLFFGAALISSAILISPPANAQTSTTTDIGMKVLTSIIGAIVGKGFESIFGGPQPVTAEELATALNQSFKSEKLKDIEADIINLRTKVRAYVKSGSIDSRREQIDAITDLADHIRSTIQVRIHSDGAFFDLLPDYMMATTTYVAFKSERRWVAFDKDATESQKAEAMKDSDSVVGAEVVHAMGIVQGFYKYDFIDTDKRTCFQRKVQEQLYTVKGMTMPNEIRFWKSHPALNVSHKFCFSDVEKEAGMQQGAALAYYPHPDFNRNYRAFKHPHKNEWFYTWASRYGRKNDTYHIEGPYNSETEAMESRTQKAVVFYSDLVGDIPGVIRHWRDVAVKIGTGQQGSEARRLSQEIGAG